MSEVRRVQQQPAWLLHHRPFRDTSRILELLTRDYGRLAVVAKASRSGKSRLKGILRPFLPLDVAWYSRAELGTLTGAEMGGAPVMLAGEALLSGYYVNELIMNLMHRDDPQPEIFDIYVETVRGLASTQDLMPHLRRFELTLLRLLGYALNLDHDSVSQAPLDPDRKYEYRAEQGPVLVGDRTGAMVFSGEELASIGRLELDRRDTLECANRLLRGVIAYHLDGRELKSRKVLRDIRRARTRH